VITRTADAAHSDHALRERERTSLITGITEQYNNGDNLHVLRDTLLPDARLTAVGQPRLEGREVIVSGIGEDQVVGVRLRVLDVVAGRNLTIVEAEFQNPADDPDHCPARTTQVIFHERGGGIAAMHLYYSPA